MKMALPAWKAVHALGIPIRVDQFSGASENPGTVRTVLRDNGYIFRRAQFGINLDSPKFLANNPAVAGFLKRDEDGWSAIKCVNNVWIHVNAEGESINNDFKGTLWVIIKAWIPFMDFIETNRTIYIRTPTTEKHVRYELEPESGYNPIRVDYSSARKKIQRAIREFATPVLISNGVSMVISAPREYDGESRWETEKLFEFDALPVGQIADELIQSCTSALGSAPNELDDSISRSVAHALYSICSLYSLSVEIPHVAAEDRETLRTYLERVRTHGSPVFDSISEGYDFESKGTD